MGIKLPSLPISILYLHISTFWLIQVLQSLLILCCANWKSLILPCQNLLLTPLFHHCLDTCHELLCASLCKYLLTPFCSGSSILKMFMQRMGSYSIWLNTGVWTRFCLFLKNRNIKQNGMRTLHLHMEKEYGKENVIDERRFTLRCGLVWVMTSYQSVWGLKLTSKQQESIPL